MLFNSNIKLLIVLLLAVVLICMVNSKGEIPNMGEVEGLEVDDTDMADEPVDAVEAIETVTPDVDEIETEPESVAPIETVDENVVQDTVEPEVESKPDTDGDMVESVLDNDVLPNDLTMGSNANINEKDTSVTAQNMKKLMDENEKNKLKFNAGDLLPREVNQDWFETDFSHAQVGVDDANLVTTDRYIVGVNTVGNSLKNPSYDIRSAPPCPKFVVSPFLNSTIEPDFNIKGFE